MVKEFISITFILILVFLLLSQGGKTVDIFNSLSSGYVNSVKALQGRG